MSVFSREIIVPTNGEKDILDITDLTAKKVKESQLNNGIVTVFVVGSTAALTTMEYEQGLKKDFPKILETIAPYDITYEHNKTWQDGNGHSHIRASLIGPSLTIPFISGKLGLGVWQQIVLVELDTRSRERKIVFQIIGE